MNRKFLTYIEERGAEPPSAGWQEALRQAGLRLLKRTPMPGKRDENWRFTDLASFEARMLRVEPREEERLLALSPYQRGLLKGVVERGHCIPVVFVNGVYASKLSRVVPGMQVTGPDGEWADTAQVLEEAFSFDKGDPFFQLNAAMAHRGVCVRFTEKVHLKEPVHLIYFYTDTFDSGISSPRQVTFFRKGSRVSLLETTVLSGDFPFTDNRVHCLLLEEGADVEHAHISSASDRQVFMNHTGFALHGGASLKTLAINSGVGLVRNNLVIGLDGPASRVFSGGFFTGRGTGQIDNYTSIEHRASRSISRQLYKGLLSGRSKGVFRGRIKVGRHIEKVDASQLNKNIVIGDSARVHTMPWLEIDSNDIRCTHGATTGPLNRDECFYLEARGLSPDTARKFLLKAFADEVLLYLENNGLREMVRSCAVKSIIFA